MFELKKQDFNRIIPLIKNISHSRALLFSVVEGNSKGRIFVDNIETPKTAFIESDFSYLVGHESNIDFNNRIINYIFDIKIPKSKDKELILFLCSDKWLDIKRTLKDHGCITIHRKTFNFDVDKYKEVRSKSNITTNKYDITKINIKLVNKYHKFKELINYPLRFGFCIVNQEEIISECISVAVGAGEAEIGIATKEDYRRRGYATSVIFQFIDYCIDNDILPNWSCWPFRKESINLAKKLGFKENVEIPAIYRSQNM
ncbi:GNAT family N-acetyltransferase [Abyssisolibacter fermentans]|uniref:GNAT family N-acetyltransferase n=1 Tax=Abyssisolibacter fermentans TaxID=1766203 RepID=UPI00082DD99E|nr:GNAT family N-acetyltransferase [Abyssisolibacter fermentans]